MWKQFIFSEPPKKKTKQDVGQCMLGATDDFNLQCNQCKSGSVFSSVDRNDCITLEPLDKIHVEFVTPDHNLKCCYNVSTLDKCRSPQGFMLQPPHFRIPMSSIDAKKMNDMFNIPIVRKSTNSMGRDTLQSRVSTNIRLQQWANTNMRSAQIWACPICWTAFTCDSEQFENSEAISYVRKQVDPIQKCISYIISESEMGRDGFHSIVSTLSASKTELRYHLQRCHGIRRAPAALLNAYSLRSDDGIIQRYLVERGWTYGSAHSALLNYWRHNSTMFGRGVGFNKFIFLYMHSYASRLTTAALPGITAEQSSMIWKTLCGPYSMTETQEDRDMIDNSDIDTEGPRQRTRQEDEEERNSADAASKIIQQYNDRDVSEYLTPEELEEDARRRAELIVSSDSESESEDEMDRYRRELREKRKREIQKEQDSSDSEDDLDAIMRKSTQIRPRNNIDWDDSEEDD